MLVRIITWDKSDNSIVDIREVLFRTPAGAISRHYVKAIDSAEQDCRTKRNHKIEHTFSDLEGNFKII